MNESSWWKRIFIVVFFCTATAVASSAQIFTTLVNFNGTNGDFFGITVVGGASGLGTVFRMTPTGTLTTPHSIRHASALMPHTL